MRVGQSGQGHGLGLKLGVALQAAPVEQFHGNALAAQQLARHHPAEAALAEGAVGCEPGGGGVQLVVGEGTEARTSRRVSVRGACLRAAATSAGGMR